MGRGQEDQQGVAVVTRSDASDGPDGADPPGGSGHHDGQAVQDGLSGTATSILADLGLVDVGADTVPSPGWRPLSTSRGRTITVIAAVAVVLGGVIVAISSGAHRAAVPPATTPVVHRHALPFAASSPAATQPPRASDPLAPGTPVDSGQDQSDPFVLEAHGHYYLYTSNTTANFTTNIGMNVPVASSTDFTTWGPATDAMPVLPSWVEKNFTWAPDVHQFGSAYVLYFTGFYSRANEQCIGDATSTSPTGPFTAKSQPFICQSALYGSIDPRVFTDDDGTNWMLWKSDENAHGQPNPTILWSQQLSPDGLGLVGLPNSLLTPDEPWQGTIVEAPDMVEVNHAYWLLYSANWFNQPAYGIGMAFCATPAGPCADTSDQPFLGTNLQGQGPGEASFLRNSSGIWMLYSPIRATSTFPDRPVYITRVGFAPSTGPYLAAGGPPGAIEPSSSP
jgi:predicted GH43/DUF377 family glycosyl hydrolase